MADQNGGAAVKTIRTKESEQKEPSRDVVTAVRCLLAFLGAAAVTLIICRLTPAKPIPEGRDPLRVDRTKSEDKERAKSAAAADGLSPL